MTIERVLAPNPSIYTGPGTNTYVLTDRGRSCVIDPGPVIDSHLAAVEHAVGDSTPVAVLVTHTHPDHAPAANPLGRRFGIPVLGFAPGPEFSPTALVADGDSLRVGSVTLQAVHTPGHTDDSVCYWTGSELFTGDHIMGGSTVVIEDAAAYLKSLDRVAALGPGRIHPGHGDDIEDGVAMIDAYIAHRLERERQIETAIAGGASHLQDIVGVVYADLDDALVPAAEHQVRIQLTKLVDEGRVVIRDSGFSLPSPGAR